MTKNRNKLNTPAARQTRGGIVGTQVAAAEALGVTARTVFNWKNAGGEAAGFGANGSIDVGKLAKWAEARRREREGSSELKAARLFEQIRKLKLANDLMEGRLIERAWVQQRFVAMAGRINEYRIRSEQEHPVRLAAAGDDIPKCREVICGVWDEIFAAHQESADCFAEPAKSDDP